MSTQARPFSDPRNTRTIDNNDPNALNKTYAGIAGTHREQQCCGGMPPVPRYTLAKAVTPSATTAFQSAMWKWYIDNGLDPREPWCPTCETELEQARDEIAAGAPAFLHMVAAVLAYVPVLGTAIAFVINTGVSLAEGEDISESVAEGVGGALPGQPASKMAYDVARAAVQGKPIDKLLVAAIPVDDQTKEYIATSVAIFKGIADGKSLTDIGLQQVHDHLSPMGQRAMEIAERAANGENVGNIALQEAAQAAKSAGSAALNNFIAQAGYQGVLDGLDKTVADALQIGAAIGHAQAVQGHEYAPIALSEGAGVYKTSGAGILVQQDEKILTSKTNVLDPSKGLDAMAIALGRVVSVADRAAMENYAQAGKRIADASPVITVARGLVDDGRYRWGFDVGTAITQGSMANGPNQDAWRVRLGPFSGGAGPDRAQSGSNEAIQGFEAAQALQYGITKAKALGLPVQGPPNVVAGGLTASGMAGSGTSADTKAGVAQTLSSNAGAKAGAAQVIAAKTGFFHKLAVFFGLASP